MTGNIKLCSAQRQDPLPWKEALDHYWRAEIPSPDANIVWIRGKHITSKSHDICKDKSWVFFEAAEVCPVQTLLYFIEHQRTQGTVFPGRIFKILVPQASQLRPVVIIEQFVLQLGTDKRLNMPLLSNMHQCIAVEPEASSKPQLHILTQSNEF